MDPLWHLPTFESAPNHHNLSRQSLPRSWKKDDEYGESHLRTDLGKKLQDGPVDAPGIAPAQNTGRRLITIIFMLIMLLTLCTFIILSLKESLKEANRMLEYYSEAEFMIDRIVIDEEDETTSLITAAPANEVTVPEGWSPEMNIRWMGGFELVVGKPSVPVNVSSTSLIFPIEGNVFMKCNNQSVLQDFKIAYQLKGHVCTNFGGFPVVTAVEHNMTLTLRNGSVYEFQNDAPCESIRFWHWYWFRYTAGLYELTKNWEMILKISQQQNEKKQQPKIEKIVRKASVASYHPPKFLEWIKNKYDAVTGWIIEKWHVLKIIIF